jgi:phage baseplate assembly protein V
MKNANAVYRGLVVDPHDPKQAGRVKVSVPSLGVELWARLATLSTGAGYGSWFIPDAQTEVLVAFEGGDLNYPYVLGSLWSSTERPPESDPARTVLRTRRGATVVFDNGTGTIEIEDTNGNAIHLAADGITIIAAAKLTLSASEIEVNAGMVLANTGAARFPGVVECDTLIAKNVVSQNP